MKTYIILFSTFFLFSCSSNEPATVVKSAAEVPVTIIPSADATPHANIYIEGMSCEKMCVSKIKKTLADIDGVVIDEVDFDADRPVDVFSVSYDASKTDEIEMIEAVQGIAGGIYVVKEVELVKKVESTSSVSSSGGSSSWGFFDRPQVQQSRFQIPNVFDAFKRLAGI